jgi:drug/metabolite transporter (DMT)-like permease
MVSSYFIAEKQESLLFIVVGVLAVAVGLWLWLNGHRLRAMAYPLIGVALIQFVVGCTVYFRTDAQIAQVTAAQATDVKAMQASELKRMAVVMQSFVTYRWVEIALIVLGLGLIVVARQYSSSDLLLGVGAGLVLQAGFMLALDLFAELRGEAYVAALKQLA